jgi:hypothetical protein
VKAVFDLGHKDRCSPSLNGREFFQILSELGVYFGVSRVRAMGKVRDLSCIAGRLAGLRFEQAVHHIVLEDYVQAVETAAARRDRLTAQIAAMLPDWSLAPVVSTMAMATVSRRSMIYPDAGEEVTARR